MRTRSQIFAAAVFERVEKFDADTRVDASAPPRDEEEREARRKKQRAFDQQRRQYGGMAHKLPVLIRAAGLAQALEFARARGKGGVQDLLCDLAKVLQSVETSGASSDSASDKAIIEALVKQSREAELPEYRRLTQQSLDALLWFKRYAQSVLKVEPSDAVTEDLTSDDAAAAPPEENAASTEAAS